MWLLELRLCLQLSGWLMQVKEIFIGERNVENPVVLVYF